MNNETVFKRATVLSKLAPFVVSSAMNERKNLKVVNFYVILQKVAKLINFMENIENKIKTAPKDFIGAIKSS